MKILFFIQKLLKFLILIIINYFSILIRDWLFVLEDSWNRFKYSTIQIKQTADDIIHYKWIMKSAKAQAMSDFLIDLYFLLQDFIFKGGLNPLRIGRVVFLALTIASGMNANSALEAIKTATKEDSEIFRRWETIAGFFLEIALIVSDLGLIFYEVQEYHGFELWFHLGIRSWFLFWTGLNAIGLGSIMIREKFYPFSDFLKKSWSGKIIKED